MVKKKIRRTRLVDGGGSYFSNPTTNLSFIRSGATTLDCTVGNGWPLGRIVNIVGDKSTGKTLLAIEAMANFARQYPKGKIVYAESEAAFIPDYAEALGLPLDRVQFQKDVDTVEVLFDNLKDFVAARRKRNQEGLYILDSLDALTDEDEKKSDMRKGSYGMKKPKQMSSLFRRLVREVEKSNVCVIVISQIRDNIGVTFGRKYSRSGGKALDFYASIVLYLAHLGEIRRTIRGIKRTVGVNIRAKCTKNKIGLPFRVCDFPIIFAYGIEDVVANLLWLEENKQIEASGLSRKEFRKIKKRAMCGQLKENEYRNVQIKLSKVVKKCWGEIETSFLPKRRKYN